jgi:hypothetical protein
MNDRLRYASPVVTTIGEVIELTQGGGTGFSDDGAGYKDEGGSCRPNQIEIPQRETE